ncbi:Uncharacterised protein [Chlamydia trachomatis]|nr:Uncharacterised protein [Chlamydia trachomatis]
MHTLAFFQMALQFPFIVNLDGFQFFLDIGSIFEGKQILQLASILMVVLPDQFFNIMRQARIGMHEPTAESNPVCLVIEFFGIEVIKGL